MSDPVEFRVLDSWYTDCLLPKDWYVRVRTSIEESTVNHDPHAPNHDIIWSSLKKDAVFNGFGNMTKIGMLSKYGKTMDGESVRCDTPYSPYFMWRFPRSFTKQMCLDVWNQLQGEKIVLINRYNSSRSECLSLGSLVFYVQYLELVDAQRYDFKRPYPYLRLHFISKQDLKSAIQWLNEYCHTPHHKPRVLHRQLLPASCRNIPEEQFKIQLFETDVPIMAQWNRHWYNPNAWFSVDDYEEVEEEEREQLTTADQFLRLDHPDRLTWQKGRADIPLIVVEGHDLETEGLIQDPNFRILTSCSCFLLFGGKQDPEGKHGPRLKEMQTVSWQRANPIEGVNVIYEDDEFGLLKRVMAERRKMGTDILCTHNGLDFDLPAFAQQLLKLGKEEGGEEYNDYSMGRDLKQRCRIKKKFDGSSLGIAAAGLISVDSLRFYKEFFNSLKSKRLGFILQHFFANPDDKEKQENLVKEVHSQTHPHPWIRAFCEALPQDILINDKQDVHFTEIPTMFFSNDPETVSKLLVYNVTDVFQTMRLFATHLILETVLAFAQVFEIEINVFCSQGTEIRGMMRLWRAIYAKKMCYNEYQFRWEDPFFYSKPAKGAIVQNATEGLHIGVPILDVKSMYPSLMMEYNLCKSTIKEHRYFSAEDLDIIKRANQQWEQQMEQFTLQKARLNQLKQSLKQSIESFSEDNCAKSLPMVDEEPHQLQDQPSVSNDPTEKLKDQLKQLDESKPSAVPPYLITECQGDLLVICQDTSDAIFPTLEAELWAERDYWKAQAAKYEKTDKLIAQVAKASEKAVKVNMNALYGLNGNQGDEIESIFDIELKYEQLRAQLSQKSDLPASELQSQLQQLDAKKSEELELRLARFQQRKSTGGKWPMWAMSALITHFGREFIEATKRRILETYPGSSIVYGDTDSLMPQPPFQLSAFATEDDFLIATFDWGHGLSKELNQYWTTQACQRGKLKFDTEAVMKRYASGKCKKYYVALSCSVIKDEKTGQRTLKEGKVKISGLELVKRDKAPHLRKLQTLVVHEILKGRIKEAIEIAKNMVLAVKRGQVGPDDLVIIQVLSKDVDAAGGETVHRAVAKRNRLEGRQMGRAKEEVSYVFRRFDGLRNKDFKAAELAVDVNQAKETRAPLNFLYYLEKHYQVPVTKLLGMVEANAKSLGLIQSSMEQLYEQWIHKDSVNLLDLMKMKMKMKIPTQLPSSQNTSNHKRKSDSLVGEGGEVSIDLIDSQIVAASASSSSASTITGIPFSFEEIEEVENEEIA